MKKLFFLLMLPGVFILFSFNVFAQRTGEQITKNNNKTNGGIAVSVLGTGVTVNDLVEEIIGTGVTYSNVSYTGANSASGLFSGGVSGGLTLEHGTILSSGWATNVIGPNQSSSITAENFTPGDADLDNLIPQSTYDAAVLEFDFIPTDPQLAISYIFGSDEYNEYVSSSFNDVFAFFLDGTNIALLPNTSTPVSINNVNNGNADEWVVAIGPCTNCSYYYDNSNSSQNNEMDGHTTKIISTVTLTPNTSHHIKLAIADAGDTALDSWVIIEGDSFGAPPPPPGVPVSPWAIIFGIFLISIFIVFRYKRNLA
jgi:hypothetical protein